MIFHCITLHILLCPGRGADYCDVYVFVCLSASISPELHMQSLPNFLLCYLWPCVSRPVAALQYVMYLRVFG